MTIISNEPIGADERAPRAALLLGWAGLLPFLAGAVALFFKGRSPAPDTLLVLPLLAYGAVVLSFLGGVRWALAFSVRPRERQERAFAFAVVPALTAWVAVALATHQLTAFLLLMGAHGVQGWFDVTTAARDGAPAWYVRLRLHLTIAAVGALAVAVLALFVAGRAV